MLTDEERREFNRLVDVYLEKLELYEKCTTRMKQSLKRDCDYHLNKVVEYLERLVIRATN